MPVFRKWQHQFSSETMGKTPKLYELISSYTFTTFEKNSDFTEHCNYVVIVVLVHR